MGRSYAGQRLCQCGCRTFIPRSRRLAPGHKRLDLRCACGCRTVIPWKPWYTYRGTQKNRYLLGHWGRGIDRTRKPPKGWRQPSGICGCGCGAKTAIARATNIRLDHYRGFPLRFIQGHRKVIRRPYRSYINGAYMRIPVPPDLVRVIGKRHEAEHRVVMTRILGRALRDSEFVHHKNGRGTDNRRANLELWTRQQPYGQRVRDLVRWARTLLARYGREFPPRSRRH